MQKAVGWQILFQQWPDSIPKMGIAVTSLNEAITFIDFQISEYVVLFERVPGRSDLHQTPPEQQDVVYRHYMEVLGDLHNLDVSGLDLPEMHRPTSALDTAMAEVDTIAARTLGQYPQPLARLGVEWSRNALLDFGPNDVGYVHGFRPDWERDGITRFRWTGTASTVTLPFRVTD